MAKTVKNAPRKARSQMAEVLHQFRKNKGAMLGGMLVLVIIFIAVFADFLLDYDTQVIGQNLAERLQMRITGLEQMNLGVIFSAESCTEQDFHVQ